MKASGATWLDRQLLARAANRSRTAASAARCARPWTSASIFSSAKARPPARTGRHLHTRSTRDAAPARGRRGQRKDFGRDRSALSFPRGGREHRGNLPSARQPGIGPLCHDRRWARIQSRALDTVIGAPAWPTGFGVVRSGGTIDWSFGRERGLGLDPVRYLRAIARYPATPSDLPLQPP